VEKVILFGFGSKMDRVFQIYENSKNALDLERWVVAVSDLNFGGGSGEKLIEKPTIKPEEIKNMEFDKVVVCPSKGKAREEIVHYLTGELEIEEAKIDYLEKYMELPNEKLSRCKLLYERRNVLPLLPKNEVVAEVGVAFGNFSQAIMKEMQPTKFYALDWFFQDNPYLKGKTGMWDYPKFHSTGLTLREYYENRFQNEIRSGQVEVRQGLSWELLEEFEDSWFGYVYLDAAHDFESVQKDIAALIPKVKKGGIIQFNDYGYIHAASKIKFGVLPAVNHFIWDYDCEVLYYCINENGLADLVVRLL